jgi:hypothetical protein
MSDWLFITAVLAVVILSIIILILYYFNRYIKPVPKPIILLQELAEPNELEEISKTIRFVLSSNVNEPAIVEYPVFFELFDTRGGKANTTIGPIAAITQSTRITKDNPGIWDFDNLIENQRLEKSIQINTMMIRIKLKDSDGRKYCYCGFFKYNQENRIWKPLKANEFYIRYTRLKCLFCLFKK